jgi:tetratricopeptide (TPR) repeat protein
VNWAYLPEAWEQSERHMGGARGNGAMRAAIAGRPNNMDAVHDQLIRFAHDVEMKSPYVSFTFLQDRLMEAQIFPYSHQEMSDLLNEAVEEMIFLHSSFQDTRSGSVKTIRTITLNHSHPEVARALGETPMPPRGGELAEATEANANLPGLMKPGGDSRLAEDLRELAKKPNNAALEFRVGERLRDLGRHVEAVEHLYRAAELAPNKLEHHCALARALQDAQRSDESLQVCLGAATRFSRDPHAQHMLAGVLADAGRLEEALATYKRALELMPEDADVREQVWLDMVKICRAMEDNTDSACDAVREALEELPGSERLQDAWRQVQEDDTRERAERLGRQATSLVSQLGREEEVISLAQEALQLSDQVYQPFYALGEIYMRQGNIEKAVGCFERAIPVCPSPGAVYSMRMRLAGLYEKLGRHEAAAEVRSLLG